MEKILGHVVPEAGMGATVILYSDRHAYTITKVSKALNKYGLPKWFRGKRDEAVIVNGEPIYGNPEYNYLFNPRSVERTFAWNENTFSYREATTKHDKEGNLVYTNRSKKGNTLIIVGERNEYFDPHF